ncbi:MAG: transporter substrate-binding domain-containing protein [Rhodobacteraceae bacterium]|nr:transporter substrate-binding domain-containing protein [Paracoccaceae bacterium]
MLARSCRFSILLGVTLLIGALVGTGAARAEDSVTPKSEDIPVRIGVRADAAPFSRLVPARGAGEAGLCDPGPDGAATGFRGYTVELCIDFVNDLRASTARPFEACFVPVVTAVDDPAAPNRFEALDSGAIDMLCGATTATLEVRSRYRASLPTFMSATGFLQNDARVASRLAAGAPLRIGVLRHTTSDVRVSADALAQRREVRARLGSARVPDTVIIDSHDEVARLICTRNGTGTGCAVHQPEVAQGEDDVEAPLTDLCLRSDLTLAEWLQRSNMNCQQEAGATVLDAAAVPEAPDAPAPTPADAAGAAPAPVLEEIDIYIGDRPILDALLARMAARGWQDGLSIDVTPLTPQPYAVIFPPRSLNEAAADLRGLPDLHFAFNRFLVEHTYNPGNLATVRQRLAAHFAGGTEASFLRLIPLMGQVPVGQEPPTVPPADPDEQPAPAAVAEQSFGE